MQKPLMSLMCSYYKASHWVIIKGSKPLSKDQKAKNSFLPFMLSKTTMNSDNQNHHCKTSLVQTFKLIFVQNPPILIRWSNIDYS
jgi:hypothetical protein